MIDIILYLEFKNDHFNYYLMIYDKNKSKHLNCLHNEYNAYTHITRGLCNLR